ncbi:MAG: single-stranded-DNA-specific exonuclease RecJ [Gammaproteobacteria bacterium]|nr:single-stranded-DNA-specific exonuclease RecJ [Gammaproteobacteria bacterium]
MLTHRKVVRRNSIEPAENYLTDLHPALRRIYLARKVSSVQELERSLDRLISPFALLNIEPAVSRLVEALQQQQRILIVADFDADGATSCALAIRALRSLGAQDVRYLVPNRFEYGYGLTPEIVALAAQQAPQLIITVDNGISSVEGVAAARVHGIDVLITDHHLPGEKLPDAKVIVNPNQPGDTFPSKNLAGVGVIFYVMLALRARLRELKWFAQKNIDEPNLAKLLDLVCLGTVADVVPLDANNRILVAQGLKRIHQNKACAGIAALLNVAGRAPARVSAMDLGYTVAPRLNAAGRLTDMSLGIECLLTDDPARAQAMAEQLDVLNRERRKIEATMQQQAFAAIEGLRLDTATLPRGLCLFDESWHQGVIGLVAARIKEHTHRPVIAFALGAANDIKGSARSVPGLHIRDALDSIAARHPGLLQKFGGHAMAAGLTLARANFDAFRVAFDEEVCRHLAEEDLQGRVVSDGALLTEELTLAFAELLRAAGPWGQNFPEPLFDGQFEVLKQRVVGEKHLKFTLGALGHTATFEAIAFNCVRHGVAANYSKIHAAYKLDVNEYQGYRSLQLIIEHFENAADAPVSVTESLAVV